MGILEKLKSVLGMDGPSGTPGTTDPEVTVEREPSTESERAVKGAGPADAPRAPRSASASADAGEATADAGAEESGPDAGPADAAAGTADETAGADELDASSQAEDADEAAAETADEPEDSPSVQEINGVGPTFAERLEAADIETVADLAAQDAATLADAAQTNESRVEDWLEQARDW